MERRNSHPDPYLGPERRSAAIVNEERRARRNGAHYAVPTIPRAPSASQLHPIPGSVLYDADRP